MAERGGDEIFVHHSAIQAEGFTTLADGEDVEYDVHWPRSILQMLSALRSGAISQRGPLNNRIRFELRALEMGG